MDNYIKQLVEEFHQARKTDITSKKLSDDTETISAEEIEEYYYAERHKISKITGIETEKLPPEDKLNNSQITLLTKEMIKLLNHYHLFPDFPDGVPDRLKYKELRKIWATEHPVLSFGEAHIEFCEYEKENCPFPGYCNTCDEVEEEFKKNQSDDTKINIENLQSSEEEAEKEYLQGRKEKIKNLIKNEVFIEALNKQLSINICNIDISDAIEVLRWYCIFISAKIDRALHRFNDDEIDEIYKYDSDGSAKIALIAIERSIAAFNVLYNTIKSLEDDILQFLRQLSLIKNMVEKTFPDARNFKRPGFDD